MYKIILVFLFTLLVHITYSQCDPQSIDSDQDGICDILDLDDDNDGIIDTEETFCSSISFSDLTFNGIVATSVLPSEIHLSDNGNLWKSSYSSEAFSLPIDFQFKSNTNIISMIGLLPVGATENINTWNDGSYKAYIHQNGNMYGKFPNAWTFIKPISHEQIVNIAIAIDGTLMITLDDEILHTGTAPVNDYKIVVTSYNGGSIENMSLTYGGVPCTDIDKDSDGDSIPNRLDLDSDNDLCVDAYEGGNNFGLNDMDGIGRLLGGVNTNGIPLIVGNGQSLGESEETYSILPDIRACQCIAANNPTDSDADGVCDVADLCSTISDALIGTTCDDGDDCTINDTYTINCICEGIFADADNDSVCDILDDCPDFDNTIDLDNDDIQDCLDTCIDINENSICDEVDASLVIDKLKVYASHKRGFYEEAFDLHLFSNAPNASIYYTTDGMTPSTANQLYNGTPIPINATTILRTTAYTAQDTATTETHSFIFLDDIILDSTLNTYIIQHPVWGKELKEALKAIPTISLVSDSTITADTTALGSMEMLFSDSKNNFQANCGIGNYGNASLYLPKRNIRMYFDSIYGPKNLKESVFEGFENGIEPIKKFDKLDLRSSHESWLWNPATTWHKGETYMATKLLDDIMLRGGSVNPHNQFVHVYIDGKYWGQYDLREKFDDNMLAEYHGEDSKDYSFISGSKVTVSAFYPENGVMKDSVGTDWQTLVDSSDDYLTWKTMVDENSFFDLMLLFMYGFAEAEWNAAGAPSIGKEFVFQMNDADLFFSRGLPLWSNRTYPQHNANGPNNMFLRLFNERHPDFVQDFGDRASLLLNYDGALTPTTLKAHMDEIAAMMNKSIIGEALKWSDDTSENPTQWQQKLDSFKINMVDVRRDIVVGQMKNTGVYPILDPLAFSVKEGLVSVNTPLDIINTNASGAIYYTLDGTDPRIPGGGINSTALNYQGTLTIPEGVTQINARIKGQEISYTQNNIAAHKPITAAKLNASRPLEVANDSIIWGINSLNQVADIGQNTDGNPWLEIDLGAVEVIDLIRVWSKSEWGVGLDIIDPYIFISNDSFNVESVAEVLTDPNVQVFRFNGIGADVFEVPINTQGRYVRLMVDQYTRMYCSEFEIIQLDKSNPIVKDIWSPMVPQTYYTNQDYAEIVINEIMYNAGGACVVADSSELDYIELYNKGNKAINLADCNFTEGISFSFPYPTVLQPGDFLVIAENSEAFELAYGFPPYNQYKGGLSNNGEKIILSDPFNNGIDSLIYNDKNPWDEHPDGEGSSLELLHPTLDNSNPLSWFRSDDPCGTPNQANSRICVNAALPIVINEINYNSNNDVFDPGNWVELYNPNPTMVDLSGWEFYDNGDIFIFPQGTSIVAEEYLILVKNQNDFMAAFPNVNANIIVGDLPFGLSKKGERISLFDNNKCLVDYVVYNDTAPWPIAPNGGGPTLALIDSSLGNALAPHWKASDDLSSEFVYGSPGKSNLCAGISNTIVCSQVSSSADDAEEKLSDGSVSITSLDLDMVNDEGVIYTVGIRFQNIDIPQGTRITSAVIEFVADEANIEATSLLFKGENIDNAPAFLATNNNISNRATTSNSVTWQPDAWNAIGDNGVNQKTVDLSLIIQEIVDRPNFTAGNAIALIVNGTGIRTAESFDEDPQLAPKLCITYSSGGCGVTAKVLLEGFYDSANSNMGRKLEDKNLLPLSQPFNTAPWNYSGTESTTSIPSGVADWILIATKDNNGAIVNQAAGFVNQDGALISVDGHLGIPIPNAVGKTISVHHKSHLAVISSDPYIGNIYDFTTAASQAEGIEQLKLIDGKYMLYAGDYDGTGIINSNDFNKWKIQSAVLNQYLNIDGDGNGIINSLDYNLWQNNKSKVGQPSIRY